MIHRDALEPMDLVTKNLVSSFKDEESLPTGMDDATLFAMGFVGHASPAVNQQYTHVGNEALRKAADSLPDLL